MSCNKLLKEALHSIDNDIKGYSGSDKFIENEELYNKLSTLIDTYKLYDSDIYNSMFIDELGRSTVNVNQLRKVIGKLVPELKDSKIQSELKRLENIIPKDSYIRKEDYYKYVPKDLSDEAKAVYENRKGSGYLNNSDYIDKDDILAGRLVYDVGDKKISEEEALRLYNNKAKEKVEDFSDLEDKISFTSFPQEYLNSLHNITKVKIDKDIYVTKSPYFSEHYSKIPDNHNVSALLVNPDKLDTVSDGGEVFKIPKGSKVAFVIQPELSKKGFTEVVLDAGLLKNAKNKASIKSS
jgi:hypothetical protein